MKLIEYECDLIKTRHHQGELADTLRQSVYEENEFLFDLLDFENDKTFLEPSLFCFFLSDLGKEKISLFQSLYGYLNGEKQPTQEKFKSDLFGLVNVPNLGYLKALPSQQIAFSPENIAKGIIKNSFVDGSHIRLCLHPTDLLALDKNVLFDEATTETLNKNRPALIDACKFLQNYLPEFWNLIESVTREFVVFSSPNHNSFAGISHHGTAYFNTENKIQTTVFFVDDIAHQCGHIIFNALTLDSDRYLRVPKNYPLSQFIENQHEKRGVYSAFHGLFTYTCILYSLDKLLESDLNESFKYEAIGRLGFYMDKFKRDLKNMNNTKILKEEGMFFYYQFKRSYEFIFYKHGGKISTLDYSNQPYIFQYKSFEIANQLFKQLDL
jgi:hypothetical protein